MPTTDPGEKRLYDNEVNRHKKKILDLAQHIQDYAGYLVNDAMAGQPSLADLYAKTIASDIAEIQRRMAVLDALAELESVFPDPVPDA